MSSGASPAGVRPGHEAEASRTIREMFGRVAPRYDLLNRLLSGRVDVWWRRVMVRSLRGYLEKAGLRYLDVCCGTGDVLAAVERERGRLLGGKPFRPGVGSDFCRPMLTGAAAKLRRQGAPVPLVEADALRFPAADASFDLITVAYGFRNLSNYRGGLAEFHRLLAPGGCLAVLEFSQPTAPLWGSLFNWYFRTILPRLGNAISGAGDAYSYLQKSVEKFLSPEELAALMRSAGFERAEFRRLTGGISCLHLAVKGNRGGI